MVGCACGCERERKEETRDLRNQLTMRVARVSCLFFVVPGRCAPRGRVKQAVSVRVRVKALDFFKNTSSSAFCHRCFFSFRFLFLFPPPLSLSLSHTHTHTLLIYTSFGVLGL